MTKKSDLSIIILAAGKGTRMKSALPKTLHQIAGQEMIAMVLDSAIKLNPTNVSVVISEDMIDFTAQIKNQYFDLDLSFIVQKERRGTADAVKIGLQPLSKIGKNLLILYGDTPLLKTITLQKMIESLDHKNSICVLGFDCFEPNNYGRLVARKNDLQKIVEFKDASVKEKQITLCNSGVIAVNGTKIKHFLAQVKNNNASGEYYLTDIIAIARSEKLKCTFIKAGEDEVMGINSKIDLAKAEQIKQNQLRDEFMLNGVALLDPKSVYFSYDTKIAHDVVIHPQVVFGTKVAIESGVEIRSFCHISGAKIKSGAIVGPFARLRPQSEIGEGVHIGNFVEIKKSQIKKGAKINHLSYIGDCEIGEESNIGAGTITCNYDGYKKHQTKIGKKVFIGSNTALVAPVKIADNAVVGAGSVITKNIEEGDLAIARAPQLTIKDGGGKYHQKKQDEN